MISFGDVIVEGKHPRPLAWWIAKQAGRNGPEAKAFEALTSSRQFC